MNGMKVRDVICDKLVVLYGRENDSWTKSRKYELGKSDS